MTTTTKLFALLILFTATSCSQTAKQDKTAPNTPPNIILLMGDDHGWDEVGYNNHPFVKTPVLDEMAASGMRFDRFYAGHPSCSPTRGSFMTGRHPNRYGTFSPNWSIRPEEITLAHLLKEKGYATAHYGKWHLGPVKKESPTSPGGMGFHEWLSHDNFFELDPVMSRNGEAPQKIEGESSQILIDETKRFIEKAHQDNAPFFIVVWFGSPHEPYMGLPEDLALYENLPDSLSEQTVSLTSVETGTRTQRPLRDVLQERYAEITAMDRAIGDLRTFLKESELKDNTLLWYCGDNGTPPSAGRTGMSIREEKGSLYEGGVLVPSVLEWPASIPKPTVTKTISVTSDFLPTLAALTEASLPARPIDGVNLIPLIQNPEQQREAPICFWKFEAGKVFTEPFQHYIAPALQEGTTPLAKKMGDKYTRTFRNYTYESVSDRDLVGERTIVDNRYKLLIGGKSPNDEGFELYDLLHDRAETENIADSHPEIVKELDAKLTSWQKSVLNSLTGADYK